MKMLTISEVLSQ